MPILRLDKWLFSASNYTMDFGAVALLSLSTAVNMCEDAVNCVFPMRNRTYIPNPSKLNMQKGNI